MGLKVEKSAVKLRRRHLQDHGRAETYSYSLKKSNYYDIILHIRINAVDEFLFGCSYRERAHSRVAVFHHYVSCSLIKELNQPNQNYAKQVVIQLEGTILFFIATRSLKNGTRVGSNTRPKFSTFLGDRAGDSRSLHFSFVVHNNTSTVLEVDKDTLLSAKGLALSNDNAGEHLLTKFRLSLLNGAHDHVTGPSLGQTIQAPTNIADSNNVQVLGASVIGAVHSGSIRKTGSDSVLDTGSQSASTSNFFTHIELGLNLYQKSDMKR